MQILHDPLAGYVRSLCENVQSEYTLPEKVYHSDAIKRGLRNSDGSGVLAGVTRIGSVQGYVMQDGERLPMPGKLYYRGIDVMDIISAHARDNTFGYEEVAYLLLLGHLPTAEQFETFDTVLSKARQLPEGFVEDMIIKAPSRNVMNKLCRGVMALYSYDENPDDISIENLMRQSIELIGRFPVIVANAYAVKRHYFDGKSLYIHKSKEKLSVAENFLRVVRQDKRYSDEEAKLLDLMLILHAEHGGGNNSAFVCRAVSSSGTDTYSAIAAAVSSLKGPLHGGANAKVMEMFHDIKENVPNWKDDGAVQDYLVKILDKQAGDGSGKIYGIGHAVYTESDPRAVVLKRYAKEMAQNTGHLEDFELMEKVERLGVPLLMERKGMSLPVCANVDMYSGLVYRMLGIPEELYTPLFAIARISGWCAHRIEEIVSGKRIIRPAYRAAVLHEPYREMDER
ncbi:MAG: citrate synthase [Eubacteriales bacterium]|nr:citrate synthase [Eubacteriales bacterium]